MTSSSSLIDYIIGANLLEHPVAIIALLLVSCAGHFTLFNFLLKFLAAKTPHSDKRILRERYDIARRFHRILTIVGVLGILGTLSVIISWFLPASSDENPVLFIDYLNIITPLIVAVHLIVLVIIHFIISLSFFRFERQRIGKQLSIANCTVRRWHGSVVLGQLITVRAAEDGLQYDLQLTTGGTRTFRGDEIESITFHRTATERTRSQLSGKDRGARYPDYTDTKPTDVDDSVNLRPRP